MNQLAKFLGQKTFNSKLFNVKKKKNVNFRQRKHVMRWRQRAAPNVHTTDNLLVICRVLCVKVVGATSIEGILVKHFSAFLWCAAVCFKFVIVSTPPKKTGSGRNGRYWAFDLQYSVDDCREWRVVGDVGNVKDVRTPYVQNLQTLSNKQDYTRLSDYWTTMINDHWSNRRDISSFTADSTAFMLVGFFILAGFYHLSLITESRRVDTHHTCRRDVFTGPVHMHHTCVKHSFLSKKTLKTCFIL